MSIAIGVNAPGIGKVVDLAIASPSERKTDSACAAQDSATETQSQGLAQSRTSLNRLLDTPGPLDRFATRGDGARNGNSA